MKRILTVLSALVIMVVVLSACTPAAPAAPKAEPTKAAEKPAEKPAEPAKPADPTKVVEKPVEPTKAAEKPADPTKPAEAGAQLPEVDPAKLQGAIYVAGSSTVYPVAEAIGESLKADGFTGELKIDSIGTGGGFKRFCEAGESDIATASRTIKDGEKDACGKLSPARNPIAFNFGIDAIAIVVSKQNTFLKNVSKDELAKIFSDKAEKWSDVNPSWPAEDIKRFIPGTDSGTFDFFNETITMKSMKIDVAADAKKVILNAKNTQPSEDDNVLVQGVEGSPFAVGFFGVAYYKNAESKLNAVTIENVGPTYEDATAGKYALARPIFLYSDAAIMKSKPQVAAFINYYLTNVNDVIGKVGYYPAKAETLEASKKAWLDAMK